MAEKNRCPQCGNELPADAPQEPCPQCLMKLGLPTGTEADKAGASKPASDVPTSATPPGGCVPPAPAELAKQFPQLDIIELLGQGGMGAVYKARQKQLDRLVALKILPPEVGRTEAFAERFTREARSLAKLSHPRIVSVHDFGHTEDGLYYFIMDYIDGTDLRRVIQSGALSATEALAIVPQICEALQFAHEEGIVHRDIKPENILLDKKGRVKIADFGLAKLLDRPASVYTLTQAGQRMGTPHYMAPEQIEHPSQVDHRADIYSLGVVFYEMLTGELPLGRFAPPSQKVQVDVRLDKVVLHSLEKEPERRYQHASELKSDVEIISAEPKASKQYHPQRSAPIRRRFSRAAIVGACWAPLFFLLLFPVALFFVSVQRVSSTGPAPVPSVSTPGVSLVGLMLIVPLLLLGFSSVFGTTILGFVSISHIRHSAGRLYGMGLALFDTLIFPLLVLDAAIIVGCFFVFRIPTVPLFPLSPMSRILLAVTICIVLDFHIVRWAWRKANKELESIPHDYAFTSTGAIPATPRQEPERPYQRAGEVQMNVEAVSSDTGPAPRSDAPAENTEAVRRRLRIPAIGLIISGAVNFLFLALVLVLNFALKWVDTPGKPGMITVAVMTFATLIGLVIILGGWKMLNMSSYGWSVACSVLAVLPLSAGFMLGFPMGVWALIVLYRSDVQKAFEDWKKEAVRSYQGVGDVRVGTADGSIQISQMEKHISIVSALHIGFGIMDVLIAIIVFIALVGGGRLSDDPEVIRITSIMGPAVGVSYMVVSIPGIICGVGLLKRKGWARILALILAIPDLVTSIPIGTIIGIYTIWALLNKETAQLFAQAAASRKNKK